MSRNMDPIGKYLRLRRELIDPESHRIGLRVQYLHRVEMDLRLAGEELEVRRPDAIPFLDPLPWVASLDATDAA